MWAFGTDESVLFIEVSLIQGVLIERFHCIYMYMYNIYDILCVSYNTFMYWFLIVIYCISFSMENILVQDPQSSTPDNMVYIPLIHCMYIIYTSVVIYSKTEQIVSRTDTEKSMIELKVCV